MRTKPHRTPAVSEALLLVLGACTALGVAGSARAQTEPAGLTAIPPALLTLKYAPGNYPDDVLKRRLSQVIGQEQHQYGELKNAAKSGIQAHRKDRFFIFSEEQVAGRSPAFAAEELLEAYKAFLAKEAAAIPDQVRLDRYLATRFFKYENGALNSNTSAGQGAEVFAKESVADGREKARVPTLGAREILLGRYALESPVNSQGFEKLPRQTAAPRLAMDRVPTIGPVPIARDAAEKLFIQPDAQDCGDNPAYASGIPGRRVEPDSKAVAAYEACVASVQRYSKGFRLSYVVTPEGFVEGTDILALRVDEVELYSPYGELIRAYMPSQLAAATDARAAEEAAEEAAAQKAAATQRQAAEADAAMSEKVGAADVDGLTLSMSYSEAEAAVRKKLEIGRVRQLSSADRTRPYFSDMTQLESADGSERIMLFRAKSDSEKLVGIGRWLDLPKGTTIDDVREQLVAKYGEPTGRYLTHGLSWEGFDDEVCGSHVGWSQPPRISEGEALSAYEQYGSISISRSTASQSMNDTLKQLRDRCSPQLLAMVQMSRLLVVLLDVSAYAAENVTDDEKEKVKLAL